MAAVPLADSAERASYREARDLWREARQAWKAKMWSDVHRPLDILVDQYAGTVWEARARALRGLQLKFEGDWDQALAEFQQVLASDAPQRLRHDVMTSLACILLNRGRFDEALRILEQVERETSDGDQKKFCRTWAKEVRRRQELQQHTRLESCGPRSLAYLLQERGQAVDPEALAAALAPYERDVQVSVAALRNAARNLGRAAEVLRIGVAELESMELPLIGLIKPGHYVVVTAAGGEGIDVYDPDNGRGRYTRERFEQVWQGVALVFGDASRHAKAVVAEEVLGEIFGGVCDCCPPTSSGTCPGCENEPPEDPCPDPGMPSFKINMVNLNLMVEDVDFRYQPSVGPQVEFKRAYNNDASTEGVFGRGWTHGFAWSVAEFPGQAQVVRADGRIDIYTDLGGGAYNGPRGVNDRLVKQPDGTFTLDLWQEKLLYRFGADGLLDRIEDRSGNPLSLGYADNRPASFGGSSSGPGPGYLNAPQGLAADASGNLYLADTANHRIQKFDATGTPLLVLGSYGSGNGKFNSPRAVAVDDAGSIFVADYGNSRVQKFDAAGVWLAGWGSYGTGTGQFKNPEGIAVDSNGAVYVADTRSHRVQKFDAEGTFVAAWGGFGSQAGYFVYPEGIVVGGTAVYVADTGNHRIQQFDTAGAFVAQWGSYGTLEGQFRSPSAVTVDEAGNVDVADRDNHRVQQFDAPGRVSDGVGRAGQRRGGVFVSAGHRGELGSGAGGSRRHGHRQQPDRAF